MLQMYLQPFDDLVKDHAFTLEVKRTDGFIEAINRVSIKFRLSQSMPREVKHQGVPWPQVLHQPLESLQYILPGWGPVWLFLCKGSSQLEFLHPSLISSDFRMRLQHSRSPSPWPRELFYRGTFGLAWLRSVLIMQGAARSANNSRSDQADCH
nr:hypothetical protein Iba_chr07cCG8060 [Ipomoea batatas]